LHALSYNPLLQPQIYCHVTFLEMNNRIQNIACYHEEQIIVNLATPPPPRILNLIEINVADGQTAAWTQGPAHPFKWSPQRPVQSLA
jgi:hypothetical protein